MNNACYLNIVRFLTEDDYKHVILEVHQRGMVLLVGQIWHFCFISGDLPHRSYGVVSFV